MDTALPALEKLGYDGIEIPLKAIFHYGKDKFKSLIKQCNLKVIVMVSKIITYKLIKVQNLSIRGGWPFLVVQQCLHTNSKRKHYKTASFLCSSNIAEIQVYQ